MDNIKPTRKPSPPKPKVSKQWQDNYNRYYNTVAKAAKKFDIDPNVAFKTLLLESGAEGNPTNLFQLMPGAIIDVGMAGMDMSDPTVNVEAAMRYMRMLNNSGVPMEELPVAWRLGKLGYDKHKGGQKLDATAKRDLAIRNKWGPVADQFLATADPPEEPMIADIRPVGGAGEPSIERRGMQVEAPGYKEGIGSVLQRYIKNMLGM